MAAWTWYGPGRRIRRARSTSAAPSTIRSRSHAPRSCSSSRTIAPAGSDPGAPPGVVQEHEREQPEDLGLVGHEVDEDPGEADRLRAQLLADERVAGRGLVALVEDEVEDAQHRLEPLGQEMVGRHAVRDRRVADLALGPDEPLGERHLRDEECPGDLRRREAAERAQRQRDLGLHREGRVAAREDESQPVVGERLHFVRASFPARGAGVDGGLAGQLLLLLPVAPGPPQPVDGPVASRRGDPGARGCPARRPAASARARRRTPPGPPPRRGRSRRGPG